MSKSAVHRQPVVQPGQYLHFKGGVYRVLCTAKHTETGETYAVYKSEKGGELWVRPVAMFEEDVVVAGRKTKRFERLLEIEGKPSGTRSRA